MFDVNKLGSPAWKLASTLVMLKIILFGRLMRLAAAIFMGIDGEPGENWAKDTVAAVFCWLEDSFLEFSAELEQLGWSKIKSGKPQG